MLKLITKKLYYLLLNSIWVLLSSKDTWLYKQSINNVKQTQETLLLKLLKKNQDTEFGKTYNFKSIVNVSGYKENIPLSTYGSYSGYVEAIKNGVNELLTKEAVLLLEPSSGSSTASKLIPYTKALQCEFQKGIRPWIFNLFTKRKKILLGSSYWSITPLCEDKTPETKIKIGFSDDSEYFGNIERHILRKIFTVPLEVSKIADVNAFRYTTLLFLLRDIELTFISIWNPSFLTLLLRPAFECWRQIIEDIRNGTINSNIPLNQDLRETLTKRLSKNEKRAKELHNIFNYWNKSKGSSSNGRSIFEEIWPHLTLLSCWADSNAQNSIKELREFFPNVEIQPKGLIATEGFISFPIIDKTGAALSINSHFFEFIENSDEKNTKLAHEVKKGRRYSVVISTGGGLYRYKLQDIIEVVDFYKQCPLVRFVSKEDKISDVCGEKLNDIHISTILVDLFKKHSICPSFFMISPEKSVTNNHYFYALFIQFKKQQKKVSDDIYRAIPQELDNRLQENYHYRYCRRIGQISEPKIFIISCDNDPAESYLRINADRGQRLGDIKPPALNSTIGWANVFEGHFHSDKSIVM